MKKRKQTPSGRPPGRIRIIGGEWRGRTLNVGDRPGLRPTPDRLRETLFNWIGADIVSSRCLDLFAGTGALGLEALSRGAKEVVFIDNSARNSQELSATLQKFDASNRASVITGDALTFLSRSEDLWDIVFLDPPFDLQILPAVLTSLSSRLTIDATAYIFIECPGRGALPELPEHWDLYRSSRAGATTGHLIRTLSVK